MVEWSRGFTSLAGALATILKKVLDYNRVGLARVRWLGIRPGSFIRLNGIAHLELAGYLARYRASLKGSTVSGFRRPRNSFALSEYRPKDLASHCCPAWVSSLGVAGRLLPASKTLRRPMVLQAGAIDPMAWTRPRSLGTSRPGNKPLLEGDVLGPGKGRNLLR